MKHDSKTSTSREYNTNSIAMMQLNSIIEEVNKDGKSEQETCSIDKKYKEITIMLLL